MFTKYKWKTADEKLRWIWSISFILIIQHFKCTWIISSVIYMFGAKSVVHVEWKQQREQARGWSVGGCSLNFLFIELSLFLWLPLFFFFVVDFFNSMNGQYQWYWSVYLHQEERDKMAGHRYWKKKKRKEAEIERSVRYAR